MYYKRGLDDHGRPSSLKHMGCESPPTVYPLGWHVIEGQHLLDLLRRCEHGESADLVYAEEWANSGHDRIEAKEDENDCR